MQAVLNFLLYKAYIINKVGPLTTPIPSNHFKRSLLSIKKTLYLGRKPGNEDSILLAAP